MDMEYLAERLDFFRAAVADDLQVHSLRLQEVVREELSVVTGRIDHVSEALSGASWTGRAPSVHESRHTRVQSQGTEVAQSHSCRQGQDGAVAPTPSQAHKGRMATGGMRVTMRNHEQVPPQENGLPNMTLQDLLRFGRLISHDSTDSGLYPAAFDFVDKGPRSPRPISQKRPADLAAATHLASAAALAPSTVKPVVVSLDTLLNGMDASGGEPTPTKNFGRDVSDGACFQPVEEEEAGESDSQGSLAFVGRHRRGYMAGQMRQAPLRKSLGSSNGSPRKSTSDVDKTWPSPVCRFIRRIVFNPAFDLMVMGLILANLGIVGAGIHYRAVHLDDREPQIFVTLEHVFCVIFTVELLLRSAAGRRRFFLGEDRWWNCFDMAIVLTQWAEVFATSYMGDVRMLRLLRLIRILRVVRTFRMTKELRAIIVSMLGTWRTLLWTMVLLTLVIFSIACIMTELVTTHLTSLPDGGSYDVERNLLHKRWGSLTQSMLALFQAISNGEDWEKLLSPLTTYVSAWLTLPMVIYVSFCVFALMNVVTGVFVESALESSKKEQERFLLQTVKGLFTAVDADQSGDISWNDFRNKLDHPDMHLYFKTIDLDIDEAEDLFRLIDINASGAVDPEDFVNGCLRLRGPAKAIDLATLMHEYQHRSKKDTAKSKHLYSALMTMHQKLEQLD